MTRIAQLIDSLNIGGAEKLQVTFMKASVNHGIKPTLITFDRRPEQHYFHQLEELGVRIIEIKGRNLFDLERIKNLVQLLHKEKFDVLHTHLTYSIILGGLAGSITGTPVVASIHNLKPDSWPFLESFALRFLTRRRIAVGYTVAQTHQSGLNRYPIDIVLNPVEPIAVLSEPERQKIRTEIAGDPSRLLLTTVGRLIEEKGYSDLLDAIHQVRQKHPHILLAIVGAGEFQGTILQQMAALQLEDHVKLLGLRSDVPRLLAASDIYVSASHWEGLPVSILEAMAAGLPVVATNVGDVLRVVKPQFGLCVPPHQPHQLAAAVCQFVENPEHCIRSGTAARAYVSESHTSTVWLNQLLDIYTQAQHHTY